MIAAGERQVNSTAPGSPTPDGGGEAPRTAVASSEDRPGPPASRRAGGTSLLAPVVAVIAAFVGLSAPRPMPLPFDVPAPRLPAAAIAAAEESDLRSVEALVDTPTLRALDGAFGRWNLADGDPPGAPDGSRRLSVDPAQATSRLQAAWRASPPAVRRGFLADRAQRFVARLHRLRSGRAEDPDSARALHRLVGGGFEARAIQSGLVEADDVVLRAAFKLRVVLAVAPAEVGLVPEVERIAFYGFLASRARRQSVDRRLRAVEELGRLDRQYPTHWAAAVLLSMAARWDEAAAELEQHLTPTVRTRNHLLWLARRQRIRSG